jgi:hypothetical protein
MFRQPQPQQNEDDDQDDDVDEPPVARGAAAGTKGGQRNGRKRGGGKAPRERDAVEDPRNVIRFISLNALILSSNNNAGIYFSTVQCNIAVNV